MIIVFYFWLLITRITVCLCSLMLFL